MALGAVGDDARRDAEVGSVEGQHALDVREHEAAEDGEGGASSPGEAMGLSEVRAMTASAATMPPIEWPMRMVRTEGSIVGLGVCAATSRSITFSRSLVVVSAEARGEEGERELTSL